MQNSNLDKNARTALENIFSKELIKALDSRAFVRGEKGLKAFEKANKESLANLDIMAGLKNDKGTREVQNLSFIYKTDNAKGISILRNELKNALQPILNQDIINKETGIIARISSTGLNKISSKKAVDKSVKNGFTRDEHFKVSADLKSLFENSHLKKSTTPSSDLKIHRYNISINVNDKDANALITLKESIDKGKNRIYSLELESLNSPF